MKKKGFTLIELLVVISIIAMLLAILMPALGKVKEMAQRVVCGTNCKGIGTSMIIYASDYDGRFPVAGGPGVNTWAPGGMTTGWLNANTNWNGDDALTVGASLYLLIREVDGDPASFVCKSSDEQVFENTYNNLDLAELWDFGRVSNFVSYAYHQPYAGGNPVSARPATDSAGSSFALLADKNPMFDDDLIDADNTKPLWTANAEDGWENKVALLADDWTANDATLQKWHKGISNSGNHKRDGQNVLFGDGHVTFEKRTDVGVRNDNIYTIDLMNDGETGRRQGVFLTARGVGRGTNKNDSFLADDDNNTNP